MSDLLRKFLRHYDPLHRGWTPNGIANGVCTAVGWFFPRVRGGYNLRRAVGRRPDGDDLIVGAAPADAARIATFPWVTHEPQTEYVYRLNAIGAGGVEEASDRNEVRARFDGGGQLFGPLPNPPSYLHVTALAGGKFLLVWGYATEGQELPPAEFRVYSDAGTSVIDYTTPVAVVVYRRGQVHYRYESGAFADGTSVQWTVRAAGADGVEYPDGPVASGLADASGPEVVPVVAAELGAETIS